LPVSSARNPHLRRILYAAGALVALTIGSLLALYARDPGESPSPPGSGQAAPPTAETRAVSRAEDTPALSLKTRDIRVEVLNGCGEPGVIEAWGRRLRAAGFDVIKTGNARSFGYVESLVLDRTGKRANADEVARTLGIGAVIQQVKEDPYRIEDVTVVIGRDHRKLGN
jgi:hypothetical protein